MVLLPWFFMASLLFSSLVILLLMPSKYRPRSNCPAPRGILNNTHKKANVAHQTCEAKIKERQLLNSWFEYRALRISRVKGQKVRFLPSWHLKITTTYLQKFNKLLFINSSNSSKMYCSLESVETHCSTPNQLYFQLWTLQQETGTEIYLRSESANH